MKKLLLALACLALIAGFHAPAQAQCKLVKVAEWTVKDDAGMPVVDGEINGKKIGIGLSTVLGRSTVVRSEAARLGLTLVDAKGWTQKTLGGGEINVQRTAIDELRIGKAVKKDWHVLVSAEGADMGEGVALVLGDDFLQNFDLELDLGKNMVRLFQPQGCEKASLAYWATQGAGVVPMDEGGLMRFTVQINDVSVQARLETDRYPSFISLPYAVQAGAVPGTPTAIEAGCFGSGKDAQKIWLGQFQSFTIGDERIRDPQIYMTDLWKNHTTKDLGSRLPRSFRGLPAMLLGTDFLRAHRVLIANSQRKMYFTYSEGTVFPKAEFSRCAEEGKGGSKG